MNYYKEIKNKLIDNEIYGKVKDYSKERNRVLTYYEVGKLLHEAGKSYGDNIIGKYSEKLMSEVGKKYNKRTLFRIRQFYVTFQDEKVSPLGTQLTWSHYRSLLSLKDINKIKYYIDIVQEQNLSKRQLEQRIKSKEYERLDDKTKEKLMENKETGITDFIKDPVVIRNSSNLDHINEKALKRLILEDIDHFLLELGTGFCYIGNEYKIKIGARNNYIDLLLYNTKFHSYVVIELKVTELKSEHIGQIEKYMNYVDKHIKTILDNKTIGIIICKKNNKFVIEYSSDPRVFSSSYTFN